MKIKICGLFREEDIDFVNEGRPDYIGFVFAKSKRQVSPVLAQFLRFRLADGIIPVGVFVDAPIKDIVDLYQKGIISIAQLHGSEDEGYITRLKQITDIGLSKPILIIKAIKLGQEIADQKHNLKTSRSDYKQQFIVPSNADYFLIDSGAGSGKTFDWGLLKNLKIEKPWFLAGGINLKNIEQAISLQTAGLKPFALDISSGAEKPTNKPSSSEPSSPSELIVVKDRKKILQLISIVRQAGVKTTNVRQTEKFEINYSITLEQNRKKLSWSIQ